MRLHEITRDYMKYIVTSARSLMHLPIRLRKTSFGLEYKIEKRYAVCPIDPHKPKCFELS